MFRVSGWAEAAAALLDFVPRILAKAGSRLFRMAENSLDLPTRHDSMSAAEKWFREKFYRRRNFKVTLRHCRRDAALRVDVCGGCVENPPREVNTESHAVSSLEH